MSRADKNDEPVRRSKSSVNLFPEIIVKGASPGWNKPVKEEMEKVAVLEREAESEL